MAEYASQYTGQQIDDGLSDIAKLILNGTTIGNATKPIYLSNGSIHECSSFATSDHNHDSIYSQLGHNHEHNHDERYYTESEVNSLLNSKADRYISGNQTGFVHQGVSMWVNNAYYWKICFPHNTSGASGLYFVMEVICGGYGKGVQVIQVGGYDYEGTSTWYTPAASVKNNSLSWKVYQGNDGSHPCILIGPGDGGYWMSCCVPWVYYHNARNDGLLTISHVTSTSGISRLYQVC